MSTQAREAARAGIRPGINLRGDDGGIVLPPSFHPGGNAYFIAQAHP